MEPRLSGLRLREPRTRGHLDGSMPRGLTTIGQWAKAEESRPRGLTTMGLRRYKYYLMYMDTYYYA